MAVTKTDRNDPPNGSPRQSSAGRGDDDADVTVHRRALSHPHAAEDEPLSEREEMARLMKSLREQIPYQDEPETDADKDEETLADTDSTDDDFAQLLRNLKTTIPDDPEPLTAPTAARPPRAPRETESAESSQPAQTSEESFTQLLRNLRKTVPDDPEPFAILEDDDTDDDDQIAHETLKGHDLQRNTANASPATAVASEPIKKSVPDTLEVAPGEAAIIAELLRSMHDSAPRQPNRASLTAGRDDSEAAHGDEDDDDEGIDRWQIWKIGLVLGSAAALGLVIALVNPFSEPAPTSVASRVVVPLPAPELSMTPATTVIIPLPPPTPEPPPMPPSVIAEAPPPPKITPPPQPEPIHIVKTPVAAPPPPEPPPVAAPPPQPEPAPVATRPPPPESPPVAAPPPTPEPVRIVAAPPPLPEPIRIVAPPPPVPEPVRIIAAPSAPPKPVTEPTRTAQPTPVKTVTAPPPEPAPRPVRGPVFHTVQIGSFKVAENAGALVKSLNDRGFEAYGKEWVDKNGNLWHVVRVGHLPDHDAAAVLAETLNSETRFDAFVLIAR